MNSGILTIAFGKEYDKLAYHTMRYSRKFTDLPICVISNLEPHQRIKGWNKIKNLTFVYSPKTQSENRNIKLAMNRITPFENTLYLDCDALIQRRGVELFVSLLENHEMVFNPLCEFGKVLPNIYKKCMMTFGVVPPLKVYNGGFIAFKKTIMVAEFFETWTRMWKLFGHGREMPPLNCAIKKSSINYTVFPKSFAAPESENNLAIIQHNFNGKKTNFCKKFNIPHWVEYKPFDGDKTDFRFTEFK